MTPEKQSPLASIWATLRETQAWRTPARCTDRRLPTACAVTSPTSSGQVQIRPRCLRRVREARGRPPGQGVGHGAHQDVAGRLQLRREPTRPGNGCEGRGDRSGEVDAADLRARRGSPTWRARSRLASTLDPWSYSRGGTSRPRSRRQRRKPQRPGGSSHTAMAFSFRLTRPITETMTMTTTARAARPRAPARSTKHSTAYATGSISGRRKRSQGRGLVSLTACRCHPEAQSTRDHCFR
jgi:hypothetical protein